MPPEEFQNAAALGGRTVVARPRSSTVTTPSPVRWMPPPLPGASRSVAARRAVTSVSPALASMAPPAREAALPTRVEFFTLSTPSSFMNAPPDAPSPEALPPVTTTLLARTVAPVPRTAPPLSPAAGAPFLRVRLRSTSRVPGVTSKIRSRVRALMNLSPPTTTRASVTSRSPTRAPSPLPLPPVKRTSGEDDLVGAVALVGAGDGLAQLLLVLHLRGLGGLLGGHLLRAGGEAGDRGGAWRL